MSSGREGTPERLLLRALKKEVTKAMYIWALVMSRRSICWPWLQNVLGLGDGQEQVAEETK